MISNTKERERGETYQQWCGEDRVILIVVRKRGLIYKEEKILTFYVMDRSSLGVPMVISTPWKPNLVK